MNSISKNHLSLFICIIVSVVLIMYPETSVSFLSTFMDTLTRRFDRFFLITCSLILIIGLVIALSPYGRVRLGNEEPEFSRFSWISMLFAAGMGSGLVFWGVAEPVLHLNSVVNPEHSPQLALALAHFHWGLHAWAIYAVSGLSIAWFSYRYQRPMTISASFSSEEESRKKFFAFDFLAVFAIIFGVAGTFANSIALIETGIQKCRVVLDLIQRTTRENFG